MVSIEAQRVISAASSQWPTILVAMGIEERYLTKKMGPCPAHPSSGKTKFRFPDNGTGEWHCNDCTNGGKGNGFSLVAQVHGIEYGDAFKKVAEFLGLGYRQQLPAVASDDGSQPKQKPAKGLEEKLKKTWTECVDISTKDAGGLYLTARGLRIPSSEEIAFHPNLAYYEEEEDEKRFRHVGDFPALVMPIRKVGGKVVGLHRIYLAHDGRKADLDVAKKSRMLWEGAKVGSAIHFDEPTDVLGIAEGPETTLYVRQVTGLPMWSGIDAYTLRAVEIPKTVKKVWIFADNDESRTGQEAAWDLADRLSATCEVRVLMPAHAGKDFLDAKTLTKQEAFNAPIYKPGDRWEEPIALEDCPVPAFEIENLPMCSWEYVLDVHEAIKCPIDYPAVSVLMSLAAIVGAGVKMRPYTKSGYSVVPNLFGCVVGGASYRKTPGTSTVFGFLNKLDEEAYEQFKRETHRYNAQMRSHKLKIEGLEQAIRKIQRDLSKEAELKSLEERLEEAEMNPPEKPKCRRYKVNTVTIKKLMELMSENDRGVFVYRDELAGLIQRWEDPKNSDERFFILEAWNGHESHYDDTLSRGRVKARACMSLFGGVHPHRMRSLVKQAIKNGSDGLIARFQLMVYPNRCEWEFRDQSENVEAKSRFGKVLKVLAETNFVEFGAVEQEGGTPCFQFTPEASNQWRIWLSRLMQRKLSKKSEHYSLVDEHLAKYPSLMASLAVLTHLAEMADRKLSGRPSVEYCQSVGLESAQKAIALCDYFEQHMRRVYSLANDGMDQVTAALVQAITENKMDTDKSGEFTVRDALRVGVCDPKEKDQLYVSLDKLISAKWLKVIPGRQIAGRPTLKYAINPRVKEVNNGDERNGFEGVDIFDDFRGGVVD